MSDGIALSADDVAELLAIFGAPDDHLARTAAPGRKRRKCKRTPMHPHCKSVRWSRAYEALRRKGKSKREAAQISNAMYAKWRQGRIVRKAFP
jgi:hypothetical protein